MKGARYRCVVVGFMGKPRTDRVLREFHARTPAEADAYVEALVRAGVADEGAVAMLADTHRAARDETSLALLAAHKAPRH